jgi:FtsH-binding integral membrane protein
MFLGLFVSGATAFAVSSSQALTTAILGNIIVFYVLIGVELALVIGLVGFIKKMSAVTAMLMFIVYSFVNGLTLSVIFLTYEISSIWTMFFVAGTLFAVMSIYGYVTNADLTKFGQILLTGLFGIIIAMVVNIFLNNSVLDTVLSTLGALIFTGLIAYDTQKLKKMNIIGNEGTPEAAKEPIVGALILYLDFINLFLDLLRLFGKRRK